MAKREKTARASGRWSTAGVAKLESSGLTTKDGDELGMSCLSREQVMKLGKFKPLEALRIDYFGVDGQPIADWPKAKPFFRLRYLEEEQGFDAQTKKKPVRYVQPPDTAPVAYYPRLPGVDWKALAADTRAPLIITEGEFKAAKATREGFPTIGLGGVYSWRSLKQGLPWLPSLEPIEWQRRAVYLCFDSDVKSNPMVLVALHELARELQARGALAFFAALPDVEGNDGETLKKTGLDDFLVHSGPSAKEQFAGVLHVAEPLGLTKNLWDLNSRFVYVRDPGLVVNKETLSKVSPSAFKEHAESARVAYRGEPKGDDIQYVQTTATAAWLGWPLRDEASRMTYAPGKPLRSDDGELNLWTGWGAEPKRGDVGPFEALLDVLFGGRDDEAAREWFTKWLAYPIQYPGAKLYTASLLWSSKHGVGKSFIGYIMGRIYGKNFAEVKQGEIHGSFNEWAQNKQFILADDVTGSDKRSDADMLKKMVTQREMRINAKFLPTYVVPDCVNYLFTSNQPDAFYLEDNDRRFFIHEVTSDPADESFFKDLELWMDSTGPSALHWWLREKVDTDGFNPAAPALSTSSKERMILNSKSDLAKWVWQLRTDPSSVLRLGAVELERDLYSAQDLLELYDPERRRGVTAQGVGRELQRAGYRVLGGGFTQTSSGPQQLFAVRHLERWESAKLKDVLTHYESGSKMHEETKTKGKKF